ncbi:MAG TPA: TatD family hydrolase [Thermoplasmata archaeon]|jgi:TatD-related deoxyribonuclease|nr:TatD family hydrolase [Thermoplasmata archaeon]
MPIFDNHIHLRPEFRGVEAAKDFERAGGTAILLTHSPYDDIPIRHPEDYEKAYRKTLSMGDAVRTATRLQVFVALGPYPVEFLTLREALGRNAAIDVIRSGIDRAAGLIADEKAIAFGEIGRPHFPVSEDVLADCNDQIGYAMERAKELGCAVVLHTEDPTPATFAEFARMASKAGLAPNRVVKHHSTPFTRTEDNHGIVPSLLAKEDLISEALQGRPRFLLETDYIDDPRRPGAVLGPATVPKKTRAWLASGLLSDDACHAIHKDLPEQTYGIELRT